MTDLLQKANPFQVTKAVDFTDEEIVRTWVDLPGRGFLGLASPASPMPLLLLGGKGSGRTHLMRYFSAVSQAIRRPTDVLQALIDDGYVGVYVRCSGLNSGRFSGKGQSSEAWADLFAYYTDLWLAQHTLGTLGDLLGATEEFRQAEAQIVAGAIELFDLPPTLASRTIGALIEALHDLQRELDIAVNNAALSRKLAVTIRLTRGDLVFGLPAVIADSMLVVRGVQFTYMLDELENFTEMQQRYINTLIREKRNPCGFMIGSRLYGFRTRATFASEEENREGSEFESVHLDRIYLREKDQYESFCRDLVTRRLADAGFIPQAPGGHEPDLDRFFATIDRDRLGRGETAFLLDQPSTEREYMKRLRRNLLRGLQRGRLPGIQSPSEVDRIISLVAARSAPLVEKLNTFLIYQDWYRGKNLVESAESIGAGAAQYLEGAAPARHTRALSLFRGDLLAQILREHNQKQRYFGMKSFVHMSSGLPRNLMIILKNVFRWAAFSGEDPFGVDPISLTSQREGVLQSSNWFYEDAPGVGEIGREAQAAVDRLATLFRNLRFADKLVESSLLAFSVDLNATTSRTRSTIRAAQQWSMLVAIDEGQRDRNSGAIVQKYQLSAMLAPRWDLPIYRRGTLALRVDEVNAIFDPTYWNEYDSVLRTRVGRLTAPFFGVRHEGGDDTDDNGEAEPRLF